MTLARAAEWCGGELVGPAGAGSAVMTGATIDTRELERGDLFVALPGANADGADFIGEAARLGACAALRARGAGGAREARGTGGAREAREARVSDSEVVFPQIEAECPARALGDLARKWRGEVCGVKVVAVTGTNGKTTTREMASAVLRAQFGEDAVLTSARNFNNHLGLPLTILRLRDSHRAAVLEMGMNHAGEIAELARIASPDIGIITNAGRGHLEGLGTVENVARAKGELIECLPPDGVAVLNADDPHFDLWRETAGERRVYSFGFARPDDAECRDVVITTPEGEKLRGEFPPEVPRHMVANTLAACAALGEFGVSDETARGALSGFRGAPGRMEFKTAKGGATLIDDSYNANPDSVLAALEVLAARPSPRVAALGDMLELGEASAELHREVGVRIGGRGGGFAFGAGGGFAGDGAGGAGAWLRGRAAFFGQGGDGSGVAGAGSSGGDDFGQGFAGDGDGRGCAGFGGGLLMLYHLAQALSAHVGGFNLFTYVTSRAVFAGLTALALGLALGPVFIRRMRRAGGIQPVRDDGPARHLRDKSGTPTMGGALILCAVFSSSLLWGDLRNEFLWLTLAVTGCFAAIGYADDRAKIKRGNSRGLTARMKLLLQSVVALAAMFYLLREEGMLAGKTDLIIPYMKDVAVPLGVFGFALFGWLCCGWGFKRGQLDGRVGRACDNAHHFGQRGSGGLRVRVGACGVFGVSWSSAFARGA